MVQREDLIRSIITILSLGSNKLESGAPQAVKKNLRFLLILARVILQRFKVFTNIEDSASPIE